jgi:hypothetical protein
VYFVFIQNKDSSISTLKNTRNAKNLQSFLIDIQGHRKINLFFSQKMDFSKTCVYLGVGGNPTGSIMTIQFYQKDKQRRQNEKLGQSNFETII